MNDVTEPVIISGTWRDNYRFAYAEKKTVITANKCAVFSDECTLSASCHYPNEPTARA